MASEQQPPQTDEDAIGKVFEETQPVVVTAERVQEYCVIMGETNPLYTDPAAAAKGPNGGLVAPPGYVLTLRNRRSFWQAVPRLRRGGGFDAGRDVELLAPIRIGDQLHLVSKVKEIYEKTGRSGTMTFIVVRSTVKNQHDQTVAEIDLRFMRR